MSIWETGWSVWKIQVIGSFEIYARLDVITKSNYCWIGDDEGKRRRQYLLVKCQVHLQRWDEFLSLDHFCGGIVSRCIDDHMPFLLVQNVDVKSPIKTELKRDNPSGYIFLTSPKGHPINNMTHFFAHFYPSPPTSYFNTYFNLWILITFHSTLNSSIYFNSIIYT